MSSRLILQEQNEAVTVFLQRDGQVVPEPAAGPPENFASPLSDTEREDLRWYLEDYLLAPYAIYEERGNAIEELLPVWGERLFAALFGPGRPARDVYLKAVTAGPVELWISSLSPEFQSLPWELLRDPARPNPLAFELAEVNRTIAAERNAIPAAGGRLRVLMVIARPAGSRDVGYRTIARPLLKRLEPVCGEVRLDVLRPPTLAALKRQLEEARDEGEPYQILHFDGHGAFGRRPAGGGSSPLRFGDSQQGYLLFETELGGDDLVAASDLAPVVTAAQVPLVVFNACQSAMLSGQAGAEAAVATSLLANGAAAVVAMSYSVYAVAAAEFMAAFYETLFAGKTVGEAVTEGRFQLRRANLRPSPKGDLPLADWMVPVHYARRVIAFPGLRSRPRAAGASLASELGRLRLPGAAPAALPGVHSESELSAIGGAFFGRDAEFHQIERALRLQHVVVLHGLGGSGKTELAKAFARWLQDTGGLDDRGLAFFHSFEPGIATFGLGGVVAAVGLRLYGTGFARLDEARRRQAVLATLRRHRMLLIWDNFETVHSLTARDQGTPPLDEEHQSEMREFLGEVAQEARGGILITSRSAEEWLGGSEIHRLQVRGLAHLDAVRFAEMLLAPLPRAQERRRDQAYPRLLEALDGHPLSLRLLLPQLEYVADAQEILDVLQGAQPLFDGQAGDEDRGTAGSGGERPGGLGGSNERTHGRRRVTSLTACVNYSFHRLAKIDQERLPALTLFEGVVDKNILAEIGKRPGVPRRFAGVDGAAWGELLGRCAEAGLVTTLGASLFQIHPALPPFLIAYWREQAAAFEAEHSAARRASIEAHAAFADWIVGELRSGKAQLAMQVLALEHRALGAAAAQALEAESFDLAQSILFALYRLFDAKGFLEEKRSWTDRCRNLLEDTQGSAPVLLTPAWSLWTFVVISEANQALARGQLAEAEAGYNRIRLALEGGAASGKKSLMAVLAGMYHQLGMVERERGNMDAAESWYRKSHPLSQMLNDVGAVANSFHELGILARLKGDLGAAERLFREALAMFQAVGDLMSVVGPLQELGTVAHLRGDLDAAERWYHKVLEFKEAVGDRTGIASSCHELAIVAQDRGDLRRAEILYCKGLEINESLGNRPGMALTYHHLGILAQLRGDAVGAGKWHQRSLEMRETLGDRRGIAASYHELGMVAHESGELDIAENWYRKSLEIKTMIGNRPGIALTSHQLGIVAQRRGDLEAAETWYRRALEVNRAMDNRQGLKISLGQLGLLTELRGDTSAALDWMVQCTALCPDLSHPAVGPGLDHLARLTAKLGLPALEDSWLRTTGEPLPQAVRSRVA